MSLVWLKQWIKGESSTSGRTRERGKQRSRAEQRSPARGRLFVRPMLEPLEERCLLSNQGLNFTSIAGQLVGAGAGQSHLNSPRNRGVR
jgi:hypothetical protein